MSVGTEQTSGPTDDGSPAGQWVQAFRQLFDSHPSHVALLGLDGTVLAVNSAWLRYGEANGLKAGYDCVGQNYLDLCEAGVSAGSGSSREAYVGLLEVIRNGRPKFTLVYPCHSPTRRQWFRMWVEPQTPSVPAVIVAHQLLEAKPWHVDDPDGRAPRGAGPVAGALHSVADLPPWKAASVSSADRGDRRPAAWPDATPAVHRG
jgi:hypothetical protein